MLKLVEMITNSYRFVCVVKKKFINNNVTLMQSYTTITISECHQSYGENCMHPCSEHCINQTCDRFNGSCLLGRKGTEQGYSLVFLLIRF